MKQTPKQFFASPAGKLTLAIVAMVLCWTVLIVYLSNTSAGGTWFPSEADMNRVRQEIKKETNTLNTETANLNEFEDLQDSYEDSLTTYWNADRDGQPETELRNLVNDAAQRAEANIQTLGSVRTSSINNELSYADLDFTIVDEYSKVIKFFAEVEKCTPRLSWRRVEIRVEPTRARAVTAPGARPGTTTAAAATTTPTQMFRTTGQVRVIKYSPAGNTKSSTAAKTTATTAAKTTTPAAAQPAAAQPATNSQPAASSAATPAQKEPAAAETTKEENGK
ncbi:MAG: hypothetical protein J6Y92_05255 [Lentisphaeria bacterium]|nr:hypothetical protein [Lentisphaeria bacterium]